MKTETEVTPDNILDTLTEGPAANPMVPKGKLKTQKKPKAKASKFKLPRPCGLTNQQRGYVNDGKEAIGGMVKCHERLAEAARGLRKDCSDMTGAIYHKIAAEHWGLGQNTASKYAKAGELAANLSDSERKKLPWTNLNSVAELARAKDDVLKKAFEAGWIHPKLTEEQATEIKRGNDPYEKKPDFDHDREQNEGDAPGAGGGSAAATVDHAAKVREHFGSIFASRQTALIVDLTADWNAQRVANLLTKLCEKHGFKPDDLKL